MPGPVHDPLLQESSVVVRIGRLGISVATGYGAVRHLHPTNRSERARNADSLLPDVARVDHVDDLVMITVKDNEGNSQYRASRRRTCPSHECKCRWNVMRTAVRQPGMHARRRVQLWIGCSHNDRHRSACREADNEDLVCIDVVVTDDLFGDTCDQGGLTSAGALVL